MSSIQNLLGTATSQAARRDPNELIPYAIVRDLGVRGEHYRGVLPIEVERITGSVNRPTDFDRNFRPKREHLTDRWAAVQRLQKRGHEFQPIEVVKVGGIYFVKDGHHRVSVARASKAVFIDAVVTEVEVEINPEPGDRLPDLERKAARAGHHLTSATAENPQPAFALNRLLGALFGRTALQA